MSGTSNPNYVKFGPTEILARFATDRGEIKANGNGEYFFRTFADGRRFACLNPDLERRLIDLGYRAGELVGITRQTRNRAAIWVVRLVDESSADASGTAVRPAAGPVAAPPAARPAPAARGAATRPAPIPDAKYAAPAAGWSELDPPAAPKPATRAIENRPAEAPQAAGVAHVSGILRACLCAAIEAARDAQVYANQNGFPLTFSADQVQDLASTLYIQESKQANIRLMNTRDEQRRTAAGGGDAWRR
jgi:hypothetical protein